jgi:hypothetical protein
MLWGNVNSTVFYYQGSLLNVWFFSWFYIIQPRVFHWSGCDCNVSWMGWASLRITYSKSHFPALKPWGHRRTKHTVPSDSEGGWVSHWHEMELWVLNPNVIWRREIRFGCEWQQAASVLWWRHVYFHKLYPWEYQAPPYGFMPFCSHLFGCHTMDLPLGSPFRISL